MVLQWIDRFARARPLAFAVVFGAAKNTAADLIIQNQVEGRKMHDVDWQRVGVFASFGMCYVGAAQYFLFNRLLPALPWIGRGLLRGDPRAAVKAVAFDQLVHMPFFYFPSFYFFREWGCGERSIQNVIRDWKSSVGPDMLLQASIFVPVQIVNFRYLPLRYRVPWVTTAGFFYVMALSATRGDIEKKIS